MNINELRKELIQKEMPIGTNEVTFAGIQYKTDENKDVKGVYIYTEEYRRVYLHFFSGDDGEPEVNPNLDYLLTQLGCETRSEDEANACKGTVVKAIKYTVAKEEKTYINVSFNPDFKIK